MIKKTILLVLVSGLLTSCGTLKNSTKWLQEKGVIESTDLIQGNVFTLEQVMQLKEGLGKADVMRIMGSPMITDIFHGNQWDYINSSRIDGKWIKYRATLVFGGNLDTLVSVNYNGDVPKK